MQTLRFPPTAVECQSGDYLIRSSNNSRWQVFLVQDLVLLSRLIPLEGQGTVELIEERHAVDSVKPSWMDEVHLLVTSYDPEFASADQAAAAIETSDLGNGRSGYCVVVTEFPTECTRLFRR